MTESQRSNFLVVRLGALGDIVHTLPAVAALRDSFPEAKIDWVVGQVWSPLVELVPCVDSVIPLEQTLAGYFNCMARLRRARYACAVDFQGLYKSAVLAGCSGAARRIGRDRRSAREPGAAVFYTDRVRPSGRHVAELNLSLAVYAGATKPAALQFPLRVPQAALSAVRETLSREGIGEYVVVSPGGGWRSKCWPAERYGALCAELWRRHGIRAVVNVGPGEEQLAREVVRTSEPAKPFVLSATLVELAALLAQAKLVVAADTGPLHLAAALGTPTIGLFGPTDPSRNGPLPRGVALRNGVSEETVDQRGAYERGDAYSAEMLSLTVAQVVEGVERELAG